MCKYCDVNGEFPHGLRITDFAHEENIMYHGLAPTIFYHGNRYYLQNGNQEVQIRFCPWCGKKF